MKYLSTSLLAICYFNCLLAQTLCPDPGATRKKVASSFHSTIMIDYNGDVRYWGDGANPLTPSLSKSSVLSPETLSTTLYSGTPLAVAASSVGAGSDSGYAHQLYLLTTTALYGWGAANGTIATSTTGSSPIVSIDLPSGVLIGDINFIASSGGGLAIVTKVVSGVGGNVYIKNGGSTGGGSVYTYGDGTKVTRTKTWHTVKTSASVNLSGAVRLSYSQKAVMVQTADGKAYAWGEMVWTGNPITLGNQAFATEVALPVAGENNVVPADINVISKTSFLADTTESVTQFILGIDGKVYAIGEGFEGILGQGDTLDATNWVTVKGAAGGNTELTGIVQISSNNAYVYADAYYSIGALNSDGQLFLWGENSSSIIGGSSKYYTLPRIPPNFSVNQAKIGYFHMGGHTTIAFLRGSNRFCYIGHLIRGSMGDGTIATAAKPAYDCINTPNAYICPPPPPLGCATPSSNDLVASSMHATLVINGQPSVTYWGQSSSSAEAGISVPSPRILYEYNGTPIGVAASAVNETTGATQMWILTSEGLWGWGYSANTINDGLAGTIALTSIPIPVPIANVSFIRSSKGGIALVTKDSMVWIKAGVGSSCATSVYGDNYPITTRNSNWHNVTKSDGSLLTGVSELSFGGTAAIAITSSGVYTWGTNIYLGNNTGIFTKKQATLMTLHADFTGTVVPKTAEIIQSSTNGAAMFLLASNGKVYSLGADLDGVLGLGATGEKRSWSLISTLTTVRKLSSNNPFANGYYSMGALTLNGTVFLWGNNKDGMLGGGETVSYGVPTIPEGIAASSVAGFEMGGHQTIIFPKTSNQFYFAGHSIGGSKGDSSVAATITAFTPGAEVVNCAGVVYDIGGFVVNDANGRNNGLVDGSGMNTLNGATLYVNLLDESGYVIGTSALDPSTGAYTFTGFPSGNYTIQVSTVMGTLFSPAPTWALPAGWSFVGDQLGNTMNTGIDATADGRLLVPLTGAVSNARIGFNRNPSAANVTNLSSIIAPSGSHGFIVPVLNGSDPEDQPAATSLAGKTISIKSLPLNGKLRYNGVLATNGMLIDNYNSDLLTLDPDNRTSMLSFTYAYVDGAGVQSVPATVIINVTYVSVSGNIVSDQNGLTDIGGGLVNGSPIATIGATPLFMSLVDPEDPATILATVAVQPDGSYLFNGIVPSGNLQAVLHNVPGTLTEGGSLAPVLPVGWGYAGEQSGEVPGAGLLSPVNGIAELNVTSTDLTDIRFAVDQKPAADSKSYHLDLYPLGFSIILNGSLEGTANPPDQLTGLDPEDAPAAEGLNGNSAIRSIRIQRLPLHGELMYNDVMVTAGQVINNYNKNLLSLNLTGTGYNSLSFQYAYLDAASVVSDTATYVINWDIALPVLLSSFNASREQQRTLLTWATTIEQNNKGFYVERNTDGRSWTTIGFTVSKAKSGTSNAKLTYAFYDEAPLPGINYYRLKQTDFDNHYQYSPVKTVPFELDSRLTARPNPATDRVTLTGLSAGSKLLLTNSAGHVLQQVQITSQTQTIDVSMLRAGSYILQISKNGQVIESVKIVKK